MIRQQQQQQLPTLTLTLTLPRLLPILLLVVLPNHPFVMAQLNCGPNGIFYIAGSTAVQPIATAWAQGYVTKCPGVTVNVTGGGSSIGARRLCNDVSTSIGNTNNQQLLPVDIGTMSREWDLLITSEAIVTDKTNEKYRCNIGDRTRTVTQIDVAIEAISIVLVNNGLAAQCVRKLAGRGLSVDQIRWMYSDFTTVQLRTSNNWDSTSIPRDDNNETSRRWNEIDINCPRTEIKLSAPGSLTRTFDYFKEAVLLNTTEGIATKRPFGIYQSNEESDIVSFLSISGTNEIFGDAIGFISYTYFQSNGQILYGVPIRAKNTNAWIRPNTTSIESGIYIPFSRRIYMNVLDTSLTNTGPYISYGLNPDGMTLVKQLGYVTIPSNELTLILARIGRQPPIGTTPTAVVPLAPVPVTRPSPVTPTVVVVTPTKVPTKRPTKVPTKRPTIAPTKQPTTLPTKQPTFLPTNVPTTRRPTKRPTRQPTMIPITMIPTISPIRGPCGLFGRSIVCPLTLCGFFGRLLGFCS